MSPDSTAPFHGASRQKIDEKGRINLPKRWHDAVTERGSMVVAPGPRGCLLLMDEDRWSEAAARIEDDPLGSRHRLLRFLFVGHRELVSPDKTGRIVITDVLRRYAGIDQPDKDTVYLVGTGRDIQVWSADRWQAQIGSAIDAEQLFEEHSSDSFTAPR